MATTVPPKQIRRGQDKIANKKLPREMSIWNSCLSEPALFANQLGSPFQRPLRSNSGCLEPFPLKFKLDDNTPN